MIFTIEKYKTKNEWLAKRGIGGTGASSILNCNPYKTKTELYDNIIYGGDKEVEDYTNDSIELGINMEPLIRNEFQLDYKTKFEIVEPPKKGNWIYRRIDKPYLTASLDGELTAISDLAETGIKTGDKGVLEIKTHDLRGKVDESEWVEGNTLPQHYYIQVLHYLMVTGYEFAYLRARLRKINYSTKEVKYIITKDYLILRKDKENEIKYLENKETDFWENNVLKKNRPQAVITFN